MESARTLCQTRAPGAYLAARRALPVCASHTLSVADTLSIVKALSLPPASLLLLGCLGLWLRAGAPALGPRP